MTKSKRFCFCFQRCLPLHLNILNMHAEDANSFDVLPLTGCLQNRLWGCALLKWHCIPSIRRAIPLTRQCNTHYKEGSPRPYQRKPLMELKTLAAQCCRRHICFYTLICVIIPHKYIYAYVALKAIVLYKQILDTMPTFLSNDYCNVKSVHHSPCSTLIQILL